MEAHYTMIQLTMLPIPLTLFQLLVNLICRILSLTVCLVTHFRALSVLN